MSLVVTLVRALVDMSGDAAVIDTGMAPYVLSGEREVEVSPDAMTSAEVDGLLTQLMTAESRRALDKHGAASCSLQPLVEFPNEQLTLVALRTDTNFWVEIRREPTPPPPPAVATTNAPAKDAAVSPPPAIGTKDVAPAKEAAPVSAPPPIVVAIPEPPAIIATSPAPPPVVAPTPSPPAMVAASPAPAPVAAPTREAAKDAGIVPPLVVKDIAPAKDVAVSPPPAVTTKDVAPEKAAASISAPPPIVVAIPEPPAIIATSPAPLPIVAPSPAPPPTVAVSPAPAPVVAPTRDAAKDAGNVPPLVVKDIAPAKDVAVSPPPAVTTKDVAPAKEAASISASSPVVVAIPEPPAIIATSPAPPPIVAPSPAPPPIVAASPAPPPVVVPVKEAATDAGIVPPLAGKDIAPAKLVAPTEKPAPVPAAPPALVLVKDGVKNGVKDVEDVAPPAPVIVPPATELPPLAFELGDLDDLDALLPPLEESPLPDQAAARVGASASVAETPARGDVGVVLPQAGAAPEGFSSSVVRFGRRAIAAMFGRPPKADDRDSDELVETTKRPAVTESPLESLPPIEELSFAEGLAVDARETFDLPPAAGKSAPAQVGASSTLLGSTAVDLGDLSIPDETELWPGQRQERRGSQAGANDDAFDLDDLFGEGSGAGPDRLSLAPLGGDFEAGAPLTQHAPSAPLEGTALSSRLIALIEQALQRGAETLYLAKQSQPAIRADGEILFLEREAILSAADVESLLVESMSDSLQQSLKGSGRVEWVSEVPGVGRVLCLVFRDPRGLTGNFRFAPPTISAEQLKLPAEVQALALEREGLILLGGGRPGDRHALAAAFVELINTVRHGYIITLENDIHTVHEPKESLISQREARGGDRELLVAMNAALREDPDVLVIHDLRGDGAVRLALETAGSGHLVIAGLPVRTASAAVEWVLDASPAELRPRTQQTLAEQLHGVVTQVALRATEGHTLFAREVMLRTPASEKLVAAGQTAQLAAAIAAGKSSGMASLDESLAELVRSGAVDMHEAYRRAGDRPALLTALRQRGIETTLIEPH